MDNEINLLWFALCIVFLLAWTGWFYLMGRLDVLGAILKAQQATIEAIISINKE